MNKKIKKAAAIAAAAVLCLSMSMSAFAAESVEDPDINQGEEQKPAQTTPIYAYGTGKDANGVTVNLQLNAVSEDVQKVLEDETAVKNILTDAGYNVPENSSVVLLAMGDYKMTNPYQDISAGAEMTFNLGYVYGEYGSANSDNLKDLNNGDTIYLLHQKADGTWEVIEGTVAIDQYGNYMVNATMTGFSPIGFIKVMSNGQVVVMDKNENVVKQVNSNTGTTTTVTAKKSPKTGE